MNEDKVLITLNAGVHSSVISGYNQLIKKIDTDCRLFLLQGLDDAVRRLPWPNLAIMLYKFQLVPPKSKDMVWCKEKLSKLLSEDIELDLVIRDSLQVLATDDYRVFYDYDIEKVINCCTDIMSYNKQFDRLSLYRHIQLFMKLLGKEEITHLCIYSFNIQTFHQTIIKSLTKQEQNVLTSFFGLIDGNPQHLTEIMCSQLSRTEVMKNLSRAIKILREKNNEFIKTRFNS